MSKAVFVMDMPENGCMDCDICRSSLFKTVCGITGKCVSGNHERGGFPNDCPLKQMPKNRKVLPTSQYEFGVLGRSFADGWNACIDAICREE